MRENIFDSSNRCIGFLVETSTQIQAFDSNARLCGYYTKSTDITYKNGSFYGKGNQVIRLIQ